MPNPPSDKNNPQPEGSGVVLLAATNRPEFLAPALLRAGRFDRQVLVDQPVRRGHGTAADTMQRDAAADLR